MTENKPVAKDRELPGKVATMRKGFIFKRRSHPIAKWSLLSFACALVAVAATPNSAAPVKRDPTHATALASADQAMRSARMTCADFDNRAEAQAFMQSASHGDQINLDEDGDGNACERLP